MPGILARGLAGVVGALPVPAEEVPDQVQQFATHLFGGQAEELARVGRADLLQRPQQAHQRAVEYLAGLGPAAHTGEAAEHLAREPLQAVAGVNEQLVLGRRVPGLDAVHPLLETLSREREVGHWTSSLCVGAYVSVLGQEEASIPPGMIARHVFSPFFVRSGKWLSLPE
jgi:hypothetical protein